MNRQIIVALVALALAGCQTDSEAIRQNAAQWPIPGADQIPVAREAVRKLLKDPTSARFPGDEVLKPGAVCGTVSAKNSYGGYGSPAFYIYGPNTKTVTIIDTNDTTYSTEKVVEFEAYRARCS